MYWMLLTEWNDYPSRNFRSVQFVRRMRFRHSGEEAIRLSGVPFLCAINNPQDCAVFEASVHAPYRFFAYRVDSSGFC